MLMRRRSEDVTLVNILLFAGLGVLLYILVFFLFKKKYRRKYIGHFRVSDVVPDSIVPVTWFSRTGNT
jgi:hypothetical protein